MYVESSYIFAVLVLVPVLGSASPYRYEMPGELDDFETIRAQHKVYVDKSKYITDLLGSDSKFFTICRPSRFGKSTFLQMLNAFFRGQKEQFKGLKIYKQHDWRTTYPVLQLNFSKMDVSSVRNLSSCLSREIIRTGRSYGIEIDEHLPLYHGDELGIGKSSKLDTLMDHLTDYGKRSASVVVLIDDYDTPLRSEAYLQSYRVEQKASGYPVGFLKFFFNEFERRKDDIKLLMATCIEPILMGHILRSAKDITFDPQFTKIMGLRHKELRRDFTDHVRIAVGAYQWPFSYFNDEYNLRKRYHGYCFHPRDAKARNAVRQYNFHSILACLRDKNCTHWSPSSSVPDPKYNLFERSRLLPDIGLAVNTNSFEIERYIVGLNSSLPSGQLLLSSYGRDQRVAPIVRMIFFGYLTFCGSSKWGEYRVCFPNDERRYAYQRDVMRSFFGRGGHTSVENVCDVCKNLMQPTSAEKSKNFVERLNNNLRLEFRANTQQRSSYLFNRILDVFENCRIVLRERSPNEFGTLKISYSRVTDDVDSEPNGLKIELSNRTVQEIVFDNERSASSAFYEVLKAVNCEHFRAASQNCRTHLMGINLLHDKDNMKKLPNEADRVHASVEDWISVTYREGRFENLRASHPHYIRMYAYIHELEPYSPLPYRGKLLRDYNSVEDHFFMTNDK